MAIVLNTTDPEDVGEEFAPAGDFDLQLSAVTFAPRLVFDLEAAVDDDADFVAVYSWRPSDGLIKHFVKQYRARVRVRGNMEGVAVTVRCSE